LRFIERSRHFHFKLARQWQQRCILSGKLHEIMCAFYKHTQKHTQHGQEHGYRHHEIKCRFECHKGIKHIGQTQIITEAIVHT
jgi:hypothetical protein